MQELTPTLEEYAHITGLSLSCPCAKVSVGHMRRQFLTSTGLRPTVLLSELTSGHILPDLARMRAMLLSSTILRLSRTGGDQCW